MTHSKQAAKRVRQNERIRLHNRAIRSNVRSAVKQTLAAETPEKRSEKLSQAMKKADKAAKAGVIHRNQAARRKSRLAKAVNKLAKAGQ